MVSNKHLSTANVKRFKKIHVPHKMYVAKPALVKKQNTEVVKIEEPVIEKKEEIIEKKEEIKVEQEVNVTEAPIAEELAAPKPKRKKKAEEPKTENNEEKPEDNG